MMRINNTPTNPGELRTKITLLSRSIVNATGGFPTVRYTTVATVWAKWVNVHGAETWAANMAQAEQPATVLIRHRVGVDNTLAIAKGAYTVTAAPASTFTGGVYELVSVDNIRERGEYIELKIKKVAKG
jgi:SPP1 family predicted phage head-tail adaptor